MVTGSGISGMSADSDIVTPLTEMLGELLAVYDDKVPAEGAFSDLRFKRQIHFGDPKSTSPGLLEVTVMSMDEKLNPANRHIRFVALRVKKNSQGGTVSSTCFHGTTEQVRAELEREKAGPGLLLELIEELASGLPEETNSNLWK